MSRALQVLSPGMLATVQDRGRRGYQRYGVPVSGAMDSYALQSGNLLVGNPRGAAALEIAMQGPSLRVLADAVVAICGADLGATLDGAPVPLWKSLLARAGQVLAFRGPRSGAWSYLCVAGGIEVPPVMGSRSTYLRAGFGGLEGRSLKAGDILHAGAPGPSARSGRGLKPAQVPSFERHAEARAIAGPQDERFTDDALESLFSGAYTVTPESDRMGYRLRGEKLAFRETTDILSDGVAAGSVQVPPDGQPIVLMADRQTTGGYAKIATVISVDIPVLAQLMPGGTVRFRRADLEEAQEEAAERERFFAELASSCGIE